MATLRGKIGDTKEADAVFGELTQLAKTDPMALCCLLKDRKEKDYSEWDELKNKEEGE